MPRELIGVGDKLIAWHTTLVTGSKDQPWLVIRSADVADLPFEQHRTKKAALDSAKYWKALEDQRHQAWNASVRKKLPRHCFDDYYVRRYDR